MKEGVEEEKGKRERLGEFNGRGEKWKRIEET